MEIRHNASSATNKTNRCNNITSEPKVLYASRIGKTAGHKTPGRLLHFPPLCRLGHRFQGAFCPTCRELRLVDLLERIQSTFPGEPRSLRSGPSAVVSTAMTPGIQMEVL